MIRFFVLSLLVCTGNTLQSGNNNRLGNRIKHWTSLVVSVISLYGGTVPLTGGYAIKPAHAAAQVSVDRNDLRRLARGLKEIDYLLDHWAEKTIYCNFGEIKKELLSTDSKAELLQAAAVGGLLDYDKSATMIVKCRSDPEVVRAFLGLTQENLVLAQAESLMLRPSTVDRVDADEMDTYQEAVERYSRAVSSVDALGYAARSDMSSSETQTLEEALKGGSPKLAASKMSVMEARDCLRTIVKLLQLTE